VLQARPLRAYHVALCAAAFSSCALAGSAFSQKRSPGEVTGQVKIVKRNAVKEVSKAAGSPDASNVVIWLVPVSDSGSPLPASVLDRHPQLIQHNKSFEPHVLVVQVGSTVQFPNKDPFFHNVFSRFDGKRFDLGLYEGGSSNTATFDRPGISFLFCNIHPEMSAVVVSVATPYFAVSDPSGRVALSRVPDGRYLLHVWYERSSPDDLKNLDRSIAISDGSRILPSIEVPDNGDYKLAHKNKYGQDYVPPSGSSYSHP
jgi:hypothetical protein